MDGLVINENGEKRARAARTQNLFRQITRIAELMGMKVNTDKTMVLCVSNSCTYQAKAFIEDVEGKVVESVDNLKILGVHFSNKPGSCSMGSPITSSFKEAPRV